MNNNQTLEMEIKATANDAIKSIDSLINKVSKLKTTTVSASKTTNSEGKALNQTLKQTVKEGDKLKTIVTKIGKDGSIKSVTTSVKNLNQEVNKTSNSFSRLSSAISIGGIAVAFSKISEKITDFMDASVDFSEQMNLFNVVFKNIKENGIQTYSELGKEAIKYQNILNENFGTSMTETLKYQALFQSMGESAGISDKYSAIMSETMTNLTYDLASLYNKQESDTAEALRAGVYAGQTKPLRTYGIDVTETSLQPILESLGISDRTVSQMSYAEKEILRYIATLKQAKNAMGDYANTIESPANQMKVFKNVVQEAKVAVSGLFIGTFQRILPYANAFLMVVKSVSQAIATMFGIELSDYNTGIASAESGYEDLADSIDDATDATNKLKRATLGFDQIHNISENNNSGSGSAVSGGIDQRLLDAIKSYDNGLQNVSMKASEIRDKIMEWLGFTKITDELTGKVSFKFTKTNSTLAKIVKKLSEIFNNGKKVITQVFQKIAKDFDNGIFGKALYNILNSINNVLKWIGENKVAKTVIAGIVESLLVVKGLSLLASLTGISSISKTLSTTLIAISSSMAGIVLSGDKLKDFTTKISTGISKLTTGVVSAVGGITLLNSSIKDISENGTNAGSVLTALGGTATTIFGTATIGSLFGPVGTAIGVVSGAIISLVTAISSYQTELQIEVQKEKEVVEEHLKLAKNVQSQREEMQNKLSNSLASSNIYGNLLSELEKYVDESGKVNKIDEDRVNFILGELSSAYGVEYKLIDGKITKWDELKTKIKETIEAEQAEIIMSHFQEEWYNSLKNKNTYLEETNKATKDITESQKLLNEAEQKYNDSLILSTTSSTNAKIELQKNKKAMEEAKEVVLKAEEAQKEWATNYINSMIDANTYEEIWKANSEKNYTEVSNIASRTSEESYNAWVNKLSKLTNEIDPNSGEIGSDMVDQWNALGISNEEAFMTQFEKLNPDIQQKLINKMNDNGYRISSELAEGLKKINQNIDVPVNIIKPTDTTIRLDTDVNEANRKIDSWWDRVKNTVGSLIGSVRLNEAGGIFNGSSWNNIPQYANGGIPSHGTMFAAGENGAEIVGNINRRTEVLNRSQIATAIYTAVSDAMSNFSGGNSQIDVVVHSDEGVIVDRINQRTKQTGICPINIPI